MKKKLTDRFEDSAIFRFITTIPIIIGSFAVIGGFLIWLGNTSFVSKKEFKTLVNIKDTMQAKYRSDFAETNKTLAVMDKTLENIKEKQSDAKKSDEKQEKLLYQILMKVK